MANSILQHFLNYISQEIKQNTCGFCDIKMKYIDSHQLKKHVILIITLLLELNLRTQHHTTICF